MKNFFSILCFFLLSATGFAQVIVNRAGPANTVQDARLAAQRNFIIPRFNTIADANADLGLDSSGALIYVRNTNTVYYRQLSPKAWVPFTTGVNGGNCGLYSGGIVTWSGSGLAFDVTSAIYCINGQVYNFSGGSITLDALPTTHNRFDVIALNNSGNLVKITGTESANPQIPTVEPSTQIYLTAILVTPAGVCTGSGNTVTWNENSGEPWATTYGSMTVNPNATTQPYNGSTHMTVTNFENHNQIRFYGTGFAKTNFSAIKFFINLQSFFHPGENLQVSLISNGGNIVTSPVLINAAYGFNKTTTGTYQNITVPLTAFTTVTDYTQIEGVVFTLTQAVDASPPTFYFDYLQLVGRCVGGGSGGGNFVSDVYKSADSLYKVINGQRYFVGRDSVGSSGWSLTGNDNINSSHHYIGTTNDARLNFGVKGLIAGFIQDTSFYQQVYINPFYFSSNRYQPKFDDFNVIYGHNNLMRPFTPFSQDTIQYNTIIGYNIGDYKRRLRSNVLVGGMMANYNFSSNNSRVTLENNVLIGERVLSAGTASNSVIIGYNAGNPYFNSVNQKRSIDKSVIIGSYAASVSAGNEIVGDRNIAIGYYTGTGINSANQGMRGNKNILIGDSIQVPVEENNGQLSIGNLIYGTGIDGHFKTVSTGNVGIGVSNPSQKLEVAGAVRFSGALMPNNSSGTAGQFLQSNGAGVSPTWVNAPGGGGMTQPQVSALVHDSIAANIEVIPIVSATDTGVVTPAMKNDWDAKASSIASANGLAGTVSSGVATLSTTITGILKGSGTAISAATAGTDYSTPGSAETQTNKRTQPRMGSTASAASITPTKGTQDMFTVTALAVNITINAVGGTPVNGESYLFRIKDNGTTRAITWNAVYRAGTDFALPTTTEAGKTMYIQFIYNSADAKWDAIGLTKGF